MKQKIIKTKKEYEAVLKWVDNAFEREVDKKSNEGEELQVMLLSIKKYEDEHYPIPAEVLLS